MNRSSQLLYTMLAMASLSQYGNAIPYRPAPKLDPKTKAKRENRAAKPRPRQGKKECERRLRQMERAR